MKKLANWLEEFVDRKLKSTPMDEINSILNKDTNSVEAMVQQLRDRVGLDLVKEGEDALSGGMADNQLDEKYDKEQLEKGIKIEMEHTNNKDVAKEIAKDHLEETKDFKDGNGEKYYDNLEKLENKMKEQHTAEVILNLIKFANELEKNGLLEQSKLIDLKIKKISEELEIVSLPSEYKNIPNLEKMIGDIASFYKGETSVQSIIDKLRKEFNSDFSSVELKKYISSILKKERPDNLKNQKGDGYRAPLNITQDDIKQDSKIFDDSL
jgi:hypothetical protein